MFADTGLEAQNGHCFGSTNFALRRATGGLRLLLDTASFTRSRPFQANENW